MSKYLFDDDFDYEKYLRDRLLEIEDLEERKALKNVTSAVLIPLFNQMKDAYRNIEDRFLQGVSQCQYNIVTSICSRKRYDETNTTLVPMIDEDAYQREIYLNEILEVLENGNEYFLFSILINDGFEVVSRLLSESREFAGKIVTANGEYRAKFKLKKADRYFRLIEQMYGRFINNHKKWKNVYAPYIYKIADVYIVETDCPKDEVIDEITIDFEEYASVIKYDCFPVWNVRRMHARTSAYPEFCKDRINYRHTIYDVNFRNENAYLVCNDIECFDVSLSNEELEIICSNSDATKWEICELVSNVEILDEDFELFTNHSENEWSPIHTKAKLVQMVEAYMDKELLEFVDVIVEKSKPVYDTYENNSLIVDEIREVESNKWLKFIFRKKKDSIFVIDNMSYIVGNIAIMYPEYRCVGVIEK